jgi:hypothetical protein
MHALVTLHADDPTRPRAWQTPSLRSPSVHLREEGDGRWLGHVDFLLRLEGRSPEELVAQLHERHGIVARLASEPVAA